MERSKKRSEIRMEQLSSLGYDINRNCATCVVCVYVCVCVCGVCMYVCVHVCVYVCVCVYIYIYTYISFTFIGILKPWVVKLIVFRCGDR